MSNLFRDGTADRSAIRHASYQLRLGDVVKVSSGKSNDGEWHHLDDFQQLRWQSDETGPFVEIAPHQVALLYTKEYVTLPDNMMAFIISRGLLFSLGLTPENTYADPGFQGTLYITIVNQSQGIIRLYKHMPLARMFVFRLAQPVGQSYVAGTDIGIEQELRKTPIRRVWHPEELRKARDSVIEEAIRKGCSIGDLIEQAIARHRSLAARHHYWLLALTVALLVLLFWPVISSLLSRIPLLGRVPKELFTTVVAALLPFLLKPLGKKLGAVWHGMRSRVKV
ncbi:MAG: hypothetical protein JW993_19310 [Sedimentisphaerales bacterium]|nr:hypothetical protein [Sedimentisphaerales bacterium]